MQQLFKAKEKIPVGLDIGTAAIKLVKLKFIKDTVELCGFVYEPITAPAELSALLKKIAQSQDLKKVNISVSGPATVIRYVNFPKMNDDELMQALKFEAPKHIPFTIDEVNLDSYILKDLADNKILVLLAAVKKDVISQRLQLMQENGLKVNIIDTDSIALVNAFNYNYSQDNSVKQKTVALLNIGASHSNLNILESGLPVLSRDIHIAGNNFTQRLADVLGLDFASAENIKLNPDKEKLEKVLSAIDSVLANLAGEIRTSFDYYESQAAASVEKIFLSGGSSQFGGLKDMLANLLGIELDYWDPLRKINISNNLDSQKIKASATQLAVALGLALRK